MTDTVVCARNEEATIGPVVDACIGGGASTVIVVADSCTDSTADIAGERGALVVETDAGDKGSAMAAGLESVTTSLVLFIDGDLVGLTSAHIASLLRAPPLSGQAVGLIEPTGPLPPLSGQRRLPTAVARSVRLRRAGYRSEILLDAAIGRAGLPHRHYLLTGVTNPSRAGREPLSWLGMWAQVGLTALAMAPELEAYVTHPNGR